MACEYCTPDESGDVSTIGNWRNGFYLDDNLLRAQGEFNCAAIYYCPMCGEKLGDAA